MFILFISEPGNNSYKEQKIHRMGHYCYECGEKLSGGVTPTTCDCIECFCARCWDEQFDDVICYKLITDELYRKVNPETDPQGRSFILVSKPLYKKEITNTDPTCPKCSTPFDEDGVRNY